MYNPLTEEFMFQEMRDRAASLEGLAAAHESRRGVRHWWQRAARQHGHRGAARAE